MIGDVDWQVPLCLEGGERSGQFHSAQPDGEPEETEDKEEQRHSFQGGWRGWIETRVARLQNGGTRSLSGKSRLWNLLLLVLNFELYGWLCGELDVVVIGHRRRRRVCVVAGILWDY